LKPGDTFRLSADGGHLWVVCSLPDQDGSFVIINMTGWKQDCDEDCLIEVGEHPRVTKKTVMAFGRAETANQATLPFRQGFKSDTPVSGQLLERIQRAAVLSPYLSPKMQNAIRAARAKQALTAQQSQPLPNNSGPKRNS
jgi:hypothetical protein